MKDKLNLLKYFLIRDIKARYAGSALGILWTFLMPVIQILLFWLVFSAILKARPYANTPMPYIYFLLSSYFFWLAFSDGLTRAANSILENADIVKKISFPNVILPVAVTLSSYIPHMIGFLLFMMIYFYVTPFSPMIVLVVPVLLLQVLFSVGMGILLSVLLPYVRDMGQMLGQLLMGLFFLSPIIYSLEAVPEKLKIIFYLNPLTYFVSSYHRIILLKEMPPTFYTGIMLSLAAVSLLCGFFVFQRLKEGFSDVL
jgi:ABC-type polysaccharide/polyol phosphate export permease